MSAGTVAVRLFAGAAEAYGAETASVPPGQSGAATIGDVVAALVASGGPGTADVLGRCSFLVAGVRTDDPATAVPAGAGVDVLPPFAGG
ncbi:MoaD/ThiS family protein [Serinibacter arcticus]|uniref:Molybdenum cofactor biosynthesis protein MoaD n=1 Tax=Serinibacter arcticus TaxID=1655435 RepID=A0A4Z1E1M0_9MICO|nr:MoaD/ThiS family protein [Serinibacter arcticus]TGO05270.1 Molybdenum cofactor biosynthesis protein MoaD [Serinibacter arcticus]